ncbi:MAG: hypothetical protein ACRCUP_06800 [Mycoplasmatales bacterium]
MINERMINIIKFLELNNGSTITEVAQKLKETEQIIHCDVKRINEILEFHQHPKVHKKAKGELVLPKKINHLIFKDLKQKFFLEEQLIKLEKANVGIDSTAEQLNILKPIVIKICEQLEEKLSQEFTNDEVLMKDLTEQLQLILNRSRTVYVSDPKSALAQSDQYLFEYVAEVITHICELDDLTNELDILNLTICFLLSLKRKIIIENKQVLLICGFGSKIACQIKEILEEQFYIDISYTSPLFLETVERLEDVEYIITTNELEHSVNCQVLKINLIPSIEDFILLEQNGLTRRIKNKNWKTKMQQQKSCR